MEDDEEIDELDSFLEEEHRAMLAARRSMKVGELVPRHAL